MKTVSVFLAALLVAALAASCESTPLESDAVSGSDAGEGGAAGDSSGHGGEAGGDCTLGEERCDCRPDGSCDGDLSCFSNLCVDAGGVCPFVGDGICDEPFLCPVGTDSDCCALPDGVCQELSMGGECPDGTDWLDCGYCPPMWVGDGLCDEPAYCPVGTDTADCCAVPGDGVCQELSMGGECPDGSDNYDCGYCPTEWLGDGLCDEQQQGGGCPTNTDPEDCCATWGDEVCEEDAAGGACPDYSDYLDCGYCPELWVEDGRCDETRVGGPCPDESDGADCCATLQDGTCEEEAMGGACPDLTDWHDCGYCPDVWIGDGQCDEHSRLWACPDGTDDADCN